MNTNPLPPELVEKMKEGIHELFDSVHETYIPHGQKKYIHDQDCKFCHYENECIEIVSNHLDKCAQIAVDYADDLINEKMRLSLEKESLKQQRDELIELAKYKSVGDELPNPGLTILARVNGVPEYHLAYMHGNNTFYSLNSNCLIIPTHWKEIPIIDKQLLKKHEDGKD